MRAIYQKDLEIHENYVLKGDALHHLVNVVRIKVNDELLLLNGKGLKVTTIVESLSKKDLKLKLHQHQTVGQDYLFDLALGIPKREALELCLKEATELGFRRIYLIRSDYSQMKAPEADRMEKLLISALEQSNGGFLPEVIEAEWKTLPWKEYETSIMLDSQTIPEKANKTQLSQSAQLLIIGPEGGFSSAEQVYLHGQENLKVVNLPTPILRTPTALAAGAGMMIESLRK